MPVTVNSTRAFLSHIQGAFQNPCDSPLSIADYHTRTVDAHMHFIGMEHTRVYERFKSHLSTIRELLADQIDRMGRAKRNAKNLQVDAGKVRRLQHNLREVTRLLPHLRLTAYVFAERDDVLSWKQRLEVFAGSGDGDHTLNPPEALLKQMEEYETLEMEKSMREALSTNAVLGQIENDLHLRVLRGELSEKGVQHVLDHVSAPYAEPFDSLPREERDEWIVLEQTALCQTLAKEMRLLSGSETIGGSPSTLVVSGKAPAADGDEDEDEEMKARLAEETRASTLYQRFHASSRLNLPGASGRTRGGREEERLASAMQGLSLRESSASVSAMSESRFPRAATAATAVPPRETQFPPRPLPPQAQFPSPVPPPVLQTPSWSDMQQDVLASERQMLQEAQRQSRLARAMNVSTAVIPTTAGAYPPGTMAMPPQGLLVPTTTSTSHSMQLLQAAGPVIQAQPGGIVNVHFYYNAPAAQAPPTAPAAQTPAQRAIEEYEVESVERKREFIRQGHRVTAGVAGAAFQLLNILQAGHTTSIWGSVSQYLEYIRGSSAPLAFGTWAADGYRYLTESWRALPNSLVYSGLNPDLTNALRSGMRPHGATADFLLAYVECVSFYPRLGRLIDDLHFALPLVARVPLQPLLRRLFCLERIRRLPREQEEEVARGAATGATGAVGAAGAATPRTEVPPGLHEGITARMQELAVRMASRRTYRHVWGIAMGIAVLWCARGAYLTPVRAFLDDSSALSSSFRGLFTQSLVSSAQLDLAVANRAASDISLWDLAISMRDPTDPGLERSLGTRLVGGVMAAVELITGFSGWEGVTTPRIFQILMDNPVGLPSLVLALLAKHVSLSLAQDNLVMQTVLGTCAVTSIVSPLIGDSWSMFSADVFGAAEGISDVPGTYEASLSSSEAPGPPRLPSSQVSTTMSRAVSFPAASGVTRTGTDVTALATQERFVRQSFSNVLSAPLQVFLKQATHLVLFTGLSGTFFTFVPTVATLHALPGLGWKALTASVVSANSLGKFLASMLASAEAWASMQRSTISDMTSYTREVESELSMSHVLRVGRVPVDAVIEHERLLARAVARIGGGEREASGESGSEAGSEAASEAGSEVTGEEGSGVRESLGEQGGRAVALAEERTGETQEEEISAEERIRRLVQEGSTGSVLDQRVRAAAVLILEHLPYDSTVFSDGRTRVLMQDLLGLTTEEQWKAFVLAVQQETVDWNVLTRTSRATTPSTRARHAAAVSRDRDRMEHIADMVRAHVQEVYSVPVENDVGETTDPSRLLTFPRTTWVAPQRAAAEARTPPTRGTRAAALTIITNVLDPIVAVAVRSVFFLRYCWRRRRAAPEEEEEKARQQQQQQQQQVPQEQERVPLTTSVSSTPSFQARIAPPGSHTPGGYVPTLDTPAQEEQKVLDAYEQAVPLAESLPVTEHEQQLELTHPRSTFGRMASVLTSLPRRRHAAAENPQIVVTPPHTFSQATRGTEHGAAAVSRPSPQAESKAAEPTTLFSGTEPRLLTATESSDANQLLAYWISANRRTMLQVFRERSGRAIDTAEFSRLAREPYTRTPYRATVDAIVRQLVSEVFSARYNTDVTDTRSTAVLDRIAPELTEMVLESILLGGRALALGSGSSSRYDRARIRFHAAFRNVRAGALDVAVQEWMNTHLKDAPDEVFLAVALSARWLMLVRANSEIQPWTTSGVRMWAPASASASAVVSARGVAGSTSKTTT